MRLFLRRLAFAPCCFLVSALAAASPSDTDSLRPQVDSIIRPMMTDNDLPGMAVGVYIDGRREFYYYGVASRDTGKPVDENTLFEIGSVSKTFNATLACYAQELGVLSLNDTPSRYWQDLAGASLDHATLLQLGTYTAGNLPLQFPDEVTNDAQMFTYFKSWNSAFTPGTHRCYSNPSVGLLGRLTALALKTDYATAIERHLLPKLGLPHTYIHVPDTASGSYAWGHREKSNRVRVSPGVFDAEAYGIKTTAADLLHFVELNIDPGSLEEPVRRAVLGTQVAYYDVGPLRQGLGWEQYDYPVSLDALLLGNSTHLSWEPNAASTISNPHLATFPVLFNKTGSTDGFGAYALFIPARRLGIVLLANRYYPNAARVRAAFALLSVLEASVSPSSPTTKSTTR